jgi:hypothetical protein
MTMETTKPLIPSAIKAGLILAVVGIIIFVVEYVAGIQPIGFIKPMIIGLVVLAIYIGVLVFLLKKYRTEIGGLISFGNAFLFCFITFLTSSIVSFLFTYLFQNYFDPTYMPHMMQAQRDFMENYFSSKMSEDQVAKAMEKFDESVTNPNSFLKILKNTAGALIMGTIASLIIAAIMKKKPAMFDNSGTGGVI